MKRDLIVFGLICLSFYIGVTMTHGIMKRSEQTAINNAIAYCDRATNCNTQEITDTLERMAGNGYNVLKHELCWTSEEGQ